MAASAVSNCDNELKTKAASSIIGRSVNKGDTATFMPSVRLCLSVWLMTSVSSGPGENPAERPNKVPAKMNSMIFGVDILLWM